MAKPYHPALPEPEQGRPPRPSKAEMPIQPPEADAADVSALQALARGEAGPDQQKRALKWIIEQACETYEWPYRPDQRATDVSLGRMFVGKMIVSNLKKNVGLMHKVAGSDAHEPGRQ